MRKYFFQIIIVGFSFFACNDNSENYSRIQSDLLTFSTDTLSFDTLLNTVNSPVKYFRVYNRNKNPLLISSVSLEQGSRSPFKINVDGFAGKTFYDIEIRANDSMYVFVDVNPDEQGTPELIGQIDNVVFVTNGVSQRVALTAWGQDVEKHDVLSLTTDTTLSAAKPYLIFDSLVVAEGVSVTIPAGATFYMYNDATVTVAGTVKMQGTVEQPVVFRGSRTDKLELSNPIPYDLIPGQWGGVVFTAKSFGNKLENVRIRNANYGLLFEISESAPQKAYLKNTVVTNITSNVLLSFNSRIVAENCEFSNSGGECLMLIGGDYSFNHCTVANYYPSYIEAGWTKSENTTLTMSNSFALDDETVVVVPFRADFSNTIFASSKNISGITVYRQDNYELTYLMRNCLFIDAEFEDASLQNCVYGAKPDSIFTDCIASDADGQDFAFDFSLKENSPAVDKADLTKASEVPFDINGKNRLMDGKPDIGAYERE